MLQTRTIAVTLVRLQADFCVSAGVLIKAHEVFEPAYSLTRLGVRVRAARLLAARC